MIEIKRGGWMPVELVWLIGAGFAVGVPSPSQFGLNVGRQSSQTLKANEP